MLRILTTILALWVCLVAAPVQAQDVPECRDAGYLARFDPTLPATASCDQIAEDHIHWSGHTVRIRAIHLRGTAITDSPAFAAHLHEAAVATGAAMERMGGDISIDNVTVLLVGTLSPHLSGRGWEYPEGVAVAMTYPPDRGDCPVSYYKVAGARTGAEFVDAMVHEMFHCIQYKRWGAMRSEYWLVEGSAEYFVYLARPNRGPDDIQSFDASIAAQSLAGMTYEAAPFFLWLGSSGGPQRVREFIFSPDTIDRMIPLDLWMHFGRDYFDQAIHMPDGRPMPSTPHVGSQTVRTSSAIDFGPTRPYTLAARDLVFERDRKFRITWPAMPPNFSMFWRKGAGGAWGDPLTLIATCSGPERYRAMWGATASTARVTAHVTVQSSPPGICTCPAGIWQETDSSTRHFFEQSALGAFGGGHKRYVGGNRVLTLNPDHSGSFSYNSIEVITGEGSDMRVDQIQTGTSRFTWSVVDGKLLTRVQPGTNLVTLNNTMTIRGQVRHETRTAGIQSIGHAFNCDEAGGLHLTVETHVPSYLPPEMAGMVRGLSVNMDFTRN